MHRTDFEFSEGLQSVRDLIRFLPQYNIGFAGANLYGNLGVYYSIPFLFWEGGTYYCLKRYMLNKKNYFLNSRLKMNELSSFKHTQRLY